VVFTHDLDFGILLALTESTGPSVVQVRTQDVTSGHLGNLVLSVLATHGTALAAGALITVDETRARVRILPIRRRSNTVG
jgi:predicted nuclease of predicted toxin-antitoxin system